MLSYNSSIRVAGVLDGTSTTFFVGERAVTPSIGNLGGGKGHDLCPGFETDGWLCVAQGFYPGNPANLTWDYRRFWSYHLTGVNFSFVDGSVRFVYYGIDSYVYRSLASRNGREAALLEF